MSTSQGRLKLLSIDGGGVRGLSAIIMLEHIVKSANARRKDQGLESLEPWQMFDMIGGTSTGGIIAVMLGRLRMTLSECRAAYEELSEHAFTPLRSKFNIPAAAWRTWKVSAAFDVSKLEDAIRSVLAQYGNNCGNPPKEPLLREEVTDPGTIQPCKVFVTCTHGDITQLAIFRSYANPTKIRRKVFDQCTILQACRATSAAPGFFPPILIGDQGQEFLDGGIKNNNPVDIILSEAKDLWPTRADDAVLISLGTGNAPLSAFGDNAKQIVDKLKQIATETEDTARTFLEGSGRVMALNGCYYRFTVPNLGQIGLEEWKAKRMITSLTENYVDNPETAPKTQACIEKLSEVAVVVTPEQVRHAIWKSEPTVSPTYELSPEEFSALHQDDLDQDYPNMAYWYREKLDPSTRYPVGVKVEDRFSRPGGIVPIGNTVLTLRRICNLLVRARFRYIIPGKYQIRWIFWFPAGKSCPPSSVPVLSVFIPCVGSTENSVLERVFPSVVAGDPSPNSDSGFNYPWSLLLHAGRPRDYSEFMEANIDVNKHPFAAPELLLGGFKAYSLDQGLWNTYRNTGWCEVNGGIVEVNDAGRIALVISKEFERRWYGGFSFGGVKLSPLH